MKILGLMYEWIAEPKWNRFKNGISSGFVPMADVEYYFVNVILLHLKK